MHGRCAKDSEGLEVVVRYVWLIVLAGCSRCRDDLEPFDPYPTDPGDPPVEDTDDSDAGGESAQPPCAVPETESNNAPGEADELPMERRACGTFETSFDGDYWRFEVPEAGWLALDADGYRIGSSARLSVALADLTSGRTVGLSGWAGIPEVHLRIPASPGPHQAFVRQVLGEDGSAGEGPDFFYELRASIAKPPAVWDLDEGTNDSKAAPQRLLAAAGAVSVFGVVSDPADQDWYEVVVPAGRYTVTFDVDAHDVGSAADPAIDLDRQLPGDGVFDVGPLGFEVDPWVELRNVGAETIKVRVLENAADAGPAYWYVLRVTVEEG